MGTFTGGARFGWANATWPLGRLTVNETNLTVSAAVLGSHSFTPSQVIEIRPVTWIPLLAQGVQIVHTRDDIPARIIFWYLGSPPKIISHIDDVGFNAEASPIAQPAESKFPIRFGFLAAFFLSWNLGILWGVKRLVQDGTSIEDLRPEAIVFIATFLALSLAIRRPGRLQRLAFQDAKSALRSRPAIRFISFVLLIFLLIALFGTSAGL